MNKNYSLFEELYTLYKNQNSQKMTELDILRDEQLPELTYLIENFLSNKISLSLFKTNIDSITKRKPDVWGFSGFSGQMFFNILVNTATDEMKLCKVLKKSIKIPTEINDAKEKIKLLVNYISELRESLDNLRKAPKFGYIPFFLSFFWQLQDKESFPTYYNKNITKLQKLDLLESMLNKTIEDTYEEFFYLMKNFKNHLESRFQIKLTLYDIEHIIYHYEISEEEPKVLSKQVVSIPKSFNDLEFVGSYFLDLENLARSNDRKEIKIFENMLGKLFSVLGYSVKILGQGTGREPDGLAFAPREQYCIIYDAKSRITNYSMGTDDRAIIEYIDKVKYDYGKNFRKFYFVIVSSDFKGDEMGKIKKIKKHTGVNSIVLISTKNLLQLLNLKFKEDLDLDYLEEHFFLSDGILSEDLFQ